ncbi:hypothetical protein CEXT_350791 [Caerostris extrusa]|uniref:BHLH domain-containing protein n=1 Tax=Caerostris extrusa TaxID=172846 RepID=A0AAV4QCC6_CAEEX|nr:hypothetical protein CEXT_350791 [Caerostris extrusa]
MDPAFALESETENESSEERCFLPRRKTRIHPLKSNRRQREIQRATLKWSRRRRNAPKGQPKKQKKSRRPRRANKQLRRLASNERERERNQTMIHAFHSLQDVLPENMGSRDRSKLETLIMAKNYIMTLTNVICIIAHIPFRYDLLNEDPLAGDSTTDGSQTMDD